MSQKRSHRDDILFLSALGALFMGLGLLLRTTGLTRGFDAIWPVVIMAVGGLLCWLSFMKRGRPTLFGGGVFFLLSGAVGLFASILALRVAEVWPLLMGCLGFAWLAGGLWRNRRIKLGFLVPSVVFVLIGGFFALFSFHIVGVSLAQFISVWWPSVFILGAIVLFSAWGASRKALPPREPGREGLGKSGED